MTAMICTPASIAAFRLTMTWRKPTLLGLAALRTHLRSALLVAFLVLAASLAALAEEGLQEWVPEGLELPADMEVLSKRSIGSSIRMFSFSTAHDGEELLAEWEVALQEAGYRITQSRDDILGKYIEFSGNGFLNAKFLVAAQSDSELSVIEFDATLR